MLDRFLGEHCDVWSDLVTDQKKVIDSLCADIDWTQGQG